MSSDFELPINIKGREVCLKARILSRGWQKKLEVETEAGLIHFERDEEGSWRALHAEAGKDHNISIELCSAIIEALAYLFDE